MWRPSDVNTEMDVAGQAEVAGEDNDPFSWATAGIDAAKHGIACGTGIGVAIVAGEQGKGACGTASVSTCVRKDRLQQCVC